MFMSKEELAIEVTQIDCVKVDDVNLTEAGKDKVLEELTSNTSGSDKKYTRLWKIRQ